MSTAIEAVESFASRRYVIPTDIVAEAGASKAITAPEPQPAPVRVADSVTLTHGSQGTPEAQPVYGGSVSAPEFYGPSVPAAPQRLEEPTA